MRISDWSSDVCSSDLRERRPDDRRQPGMVDRRQRLLHRMRDRRARAFEPDLAHRLAEFEPTLGLVERLGIGADHLDAVLLPLIGVQMRSEEHTSELQSLLRISYAVFCLKKNTNETLY